MQSWPSNKCDPRHRRVGEQRSSSVLATHPAARERARAARQHPASVAGARVNRDHRARASIETGRRRDSSAAPTTTSRSRSRPDEIIHLVGQDARAPTSRAPQERAERRCLCSAALTSSRPERAHAPASTRSSDYGRKRRHRVVQGRERHGKGSSRNASTRRASHRAALVEDCARPRRCSKRACRSREGRRHRAVRADICRFEQRPTGRVSQVLQDAPRADSARGWRSRSISLPVPLSPCTSRWRRFRP